MMELNGLNLGYNCSVPGLYTAGCSGEVGIAQSVKGNNLPGSADTSYGLSLTKYFPGEGVTSARVSYSIQVKLI